MKLQILKQVACTHALPPLQKIDLMVSWYKSTFRGTIQVCWVICLLSSITNNRCHGYIYTKIAKLYKSMQLQNSRVKRDGRHTNSHKLSILKFLPLSSFLGHQLWFHISKDLGLGTKFTWIVIINIFVIELLSQPFLGYHLLFHIFFLPGIFGPHTFFTAWLFLYRYHFFFCNSIFITHQSWS